jgi:hypothetical protein
MHKKEAEFAHKMSKANDINGLVAQRIGIFITSDINRRNIE